jgi:hypothetical protein
MPTSTIATSTNTTPFIYPSTKLMVYDLAFGYYWCMVKSSTANTYTVYRSTDQGASWASYASVVRANIVEIGSMVAYGGAPPWFMYWCYRTNESSEDRIYMRRFDLSTGTWEAERLVYSVANGGVAGTFFSGLDIKVMVTPASGTFVVIAAGTKLGGPINGVSLYGVWEPVYTDPNSWQVTQGIFQGTTQWYPETGSGRISPSLDIEHTGDSLAHGVSPNLWLAWGSTSLYMVKLAFIGGGWSGPSTPVLVRSGITAQDATVGRWDGQRFLMAVPNPTAGATSTVSVFERNQANSATIERTTPVHPTGVVRNCSLSYNSVSGDFRVFAVGTSTTVLYYVDFIRATGLWSSWTSVLATAVLGATGNNWGVRAATAYNAKYDVYTAHASNTLTLTQQSLSYAPFAPTWVTPVSGLAADVGLTLLLDWTFNDPDPADTQKDFAISRQIGAGALAYFRASDSTWQPAEVQNASGTTSRTLAAAWGVHTDAAHVYKVKVWDQSNVASAYSDAMAVVPSTPVNPSITAPTAAQVLTGDSVTVTWTVADQSAFRVRLVVAGLTVFDSGFVASTALTYLVPFALANFTSYSAFLTTRNVEGLASTEIQRDFSTLFIEPATPTTTATPLPDSGVMRVAITNPTPVGTQPAAISHDLYRRPVQSAFLAEFDFEVNLTGWIASAGGAGVATITRDNTFAHKGSWSMKVVPAGGGPNAYGETTAFWPAAPNQAWEAAAWIYTVTANKPATVWMHWFTAGSVYIISSLTQRAAVAGAWLYVSVNAVPPPTATKFVIAAGVSNNPGVGDISYVDEVWGRLADPSVGVRVAAGVAPGGTVDDWQAVSSVNYEYRATSRGANNTTTPGAWRQ